MFAADDLRLFNMFGFSFELELASVVPNSMLWCSVAGGEAGNAGRAPFAVPGCLKMPKLIDFFCG